MTKGIIFDLDGVIVFTDKFHYLAWKKIADELGVPFDEKVNNRLRGVSRMESLEIVLERYEGCALSEQQKIELATKKNEIYREYLKTMTPADVSADVRQTLAELKKRGYRLAIGSSSKNAGFILEQTDMRNMFDAVSDGNNISRSKPDPEVFLKGAQYIGLNAEQCAVVEDARAGIDAAKAGGMLAVAIGDAASYERADIRLTCFSDLLKHFN